MRTMWYMGSKNRLVPGFIDSAIASVTLKNGSVLDIFGGAGSVSLNLVSRYTVTANDAQKYSRVTLGSLIEHGPRSASRLVTELNFEAVLGSSFEEHFERLAKCFQAALREEQDALAECRAGQFTRYRRFLDQVPRFPQKQPPAKIWQDSTEFFAPEVIKRTRKAIRAASRRGHPQSLTPLAQNYHLITSYYANIYFGLKQSLELDALRYAINRFTGPCLQRQKQHYLSALLYAASTSTSGTSHFAQPRSLKSDRDLKKVAERRSLSIFALAKEQSEQLRRFISKTRYRSGNKCYHGDYARALQLAGSRCSTVYADPPYTADNYSRFYHVLEVLTRYDYPELARSRGQLTKGRYPNRRYRFQSQFCRRSQVEEAFRGFVSACANSNNSLVLSYAKPTGLLFRSWLGKMSKQRAEQRFLELFREHYHQVEIRQFSTQHSGQGDSHIPVTELLVVCQAPKKYVPEPLKTKPQSQLERLPCAI